MDCTVVCSDIHDPSDASLLWDSVRVITRLLEQLRDQTRGIEICFKDHRRVAKRRALAIRTAKNAKIRKRLYRDLLRYTEKVLSYAENAIGAIEAGCCLSSMKVLDRLKTVMGLTYRVIDQTTRRVMMGENVPAEDKVVSLFEPHTDIIKKDRRETFYGHKVCLTVGQSNLVTDCLITSGNPADSTLVEDMLNRHDTIYGRYPLKVALDGGFASKNNLNFAKSRGIKDVCFGKRRGMKMEDMCRSSYVYKRLRRFRAGIESAISWLKRCFGFDRCTWKSLSSFKSYAWCSVVSGNLLTLARSSIFE
jgi:IS5 family transposase